MNMLKKFWRWLDGLKTLAFGLIVALTPMVVDVWSMLSPDQMRALFSPETISIIGVIIVVLRVITTGPVRGRK